jgi:acyl dehydratase
VTQAPVALKPVLYENLEVGEVLGPIDLVVDAALARRHAFTVDDYRRLPGAGAVATAHREPVEPSSLLGELLRLLNTRYDPHEDVGLHQREEAWFHVAPQLGDTVRLEGRVVDKFVKRGRGYFVVEAEARRISDGVLLVRHRATEAVGIGDPARLGAGSAEPKADSRRVRGVYPTDQPVVASAQDSPSVGDPLPTLEKQIDQAQISVYSNVAEFWRTTHTDREKAQAEGLPSPIAQGLMNACYISELCGEFFGETWSKTGHLELVFVAPMYPRDTVEVRAVVNRIDTTDDGARIELETWVQRPDGTKLAMGWADAEVAARVSGEVSP